MTDCDNLLRLFLNTQVNEVEDIGYFKCIALLKLMLENNCELNKEDHKKWSDKLNVLHNMAKKAALSSTNLNEEEEHLLYHQAKQAAETAIAEINKELGLNGGSRRRRASKKSKKSNKSKKSRKSKKTKSRRH
jgi:hypothetical protein